MVAVPFAAAAQLLPPPTLAETGASNFSIFVRGVPLGTEQIAVVRNAGGWMIASSGRLGAPIDAVVRRLEVRYTADWNPVELTQDATVRGQEQRLHTTVEANVAKSEIVTSGQTSQKSDTIAAGALLVLPINFFSPVRSARGQAQDRRGRFGDSDLPGATGFGHHPRRRYVAGENPDQRPHRQRTADAFRAAAPGRQRRRRHLGRRRQPDDSLERPGTGTRSRARGHRGRVIALGDHLATERRAGEDSEQRIFARRHRFETCHRGLRAAARRGPRRREWPGRS